MSLLKSNLIRVSFLSIIAGAIVACGGGSNSGAGESLAQERQAVDCVDFGDGTVINLCNFPIVVRTFGGTSTPVTVPANGIVADPDATVFAFVGACEAPFTPVETSATEFECI